MHEFFRRSRRVGGSSDGLGITPKPQAPSNLRETFALLARARVCGGIESALELFDWTQVNPHQVYQAVLGRSPESAHLVGATQQYDAKLHFFECLHSEEFQSNSIDFLLRALEHHRRIIFVHIPKCAGSDCIHYFANRYPSISQTYTDRSVISADALLERLSSAVIDSLNTSEIFVSGHFPLAFAQQRYHRFGDSLFSIIRRPREIHLSAVNYIIGLLADDINVERPDVKIWWNQLNRPPIQAPPSDSCWIDLAHEVLLNKQIVPANHICNHLGSGTCVDAMDTLMLAPISLIHIRHYSNWLGRVLGRPTILPRVNVSRPYLSWDALSHDEQRYIDEMTGEDQKFFDLFETVCKRTGSDIIDGADMYAFRKPG